MTITANGSLTLGEKYSLSCTASCLARVTSQSIQWVSPEGTLITRAVSNSMATSTLTFSPLGFSDAGEYTCQLVGGASTEAVETWIVEVESEKRVQAPNMHSKYIQLATNVRIHVLWLCKLVDMSIPD